MGCFNTTGFHSKLPIVYGDKIFSIICLRMDAFDDDFLRFSPGYQVTPMFLPIFGEYNDYGNITNIERTPSVESIERIFGDTIENIMRAIQDIMWGQERGDICGKIKGYVEKINHPSHNFTICYTMDHKFVYDEIATLPHSMDISYLLKSKSWEMTKEYHLEDYKSWKERQEDEDDVSYWEYTHYLMKKKIEHNFTGLNPNLIGHEYGWLYTRGEYYLGDVLLYPYKEYVNDLFNDDMRAPYLKFIAFYKAFRAYDWEFTLNIFGGQNHLHENMLRYYEECVRFLEKKIEQNKEDYDDDED